MRSFCLRSRHDSLAFALPMAHARRPSPFPTSQPPAIPPGAAATRPAEREPISDLTKQVGDNIRERRRARGYSSSALSRASSVSRAMLSRIERGIVSASLTTLARVAEALDVDVEELVATRVLAGTFVLAPAGSASTTYFAEETAAFRHIGQIANRAITLRTTVVTLGAEPPSESTPFGEGAVFAFVLAGKASCEFRDRKIQLARGDGVFLDSRTLRWSISGPGAPAQLLVVEAVSR